MRFAVSCRGCSARLVLGDEHIGRRVQCRCGTVMRMPKALPPKPNNPPAAVARPIAPPSDINSLPIAMPVDDGPIGNVNEHKKAVGKEAFDLNADDQLISFRPEADAFTGPDIDDEPLEIPDENILD